MFPFDVKTSRSPPAERLASAAAPMYRLALDIETFF